MLYFFSIFCPPLVIKIENISFSFNCSCSYFNAISVHNIFNICNRFHIELWNSNSKRYFIISNDLCLISNYQKIIIISTCINWCYLGFWFILILFVILKSEQHGNKHLRVFNGIYDGFNLKSTNKITIKQKKNYWRVLTMVERVFYTWKWSKYFKYICHFHHCFSFKNLV